MTKELFEGKKLWTKDGRHIGNAVIIGKVESTELGIIYMAKTDFGNHAEFTMNEIESLFYLEGGRTY